ncbi:hypothetical protein VNO77_33909 [Canavalia gladiata]|uniref:Homogentisate phytyltransferase 1, chloroplastic n=1 Tax=Canavalia gladiata TaxID=3824 RepID=A0AAN9PWT0_CANGL
MIGSYGPKASGKKGKVQKEYNFMRSQQLSLNHHYKCIERSFTCQEWNEKYCVKVASKQSSESESQALYKESILDSIESSLDVFRSLLKAVVAVSFMNLYVVGVNHLSDVEIDKINKPHRPIASGEYSFGTGVIITASSLILSFWHSWIVGSWPLFWVVFTYFALGTAYSVNVPMLRWKKSPVLAAMCILIFRAVAINLGVYLHMQTHVYKRAAIFSRPLIFATVFMSFFSIAMAMLKDFPDIEGDRKFGIQSFAVLLGKKRGLGHIFLASVLGYHAKSIDFSSNASTTFFYSLIWKFQNSFLSVHALRLDSSLV